MKKIGRPKKQPDTSHYKLTLEFNGETFTAFGKTVEEAILAITPPKTKGKGVFTLEYMGKTSRKMPMYMWQMSRLFGDSLSGQMQRSVLQKKLIL